MTPLDSFIKWMEDTFSLTFAQDLYTGEAPSSLDNENPVTWVVMNGGGNEMKFLTGETHEIWGFDIRHRNVSFEDAQSFAHELVRKLNCSSCVEFDGYDIIELVANSTPVDNDRDSEDRKVVLIQASAVINKNC